MVFVSSVTVESFAMFSFEDVYWKKVLYRFKVVVIATLTNRIEVYARLNDVAKNTVLNN